MKRFHISLLLSLLFLLPSFVSPASAAQNGPVVATAVVVPASTTRLSFLTSALVKEVTVREGDEVTAGQTLAVLDTPDLEYNMIAAQEEFRARQAYAELQRYKRVLDIRNGKKFWDVVPPEVRQRADAQAASAQAMMEATQAGFTQSALVAPYDATVATVDVVPGEFVQQGQVVMTLATLNNLQLETTDLSERDITKVKNGASVSIFVEALEESFTGEVIRIAPMANTVGGDVVFKVTIAFDRQPEDILWGMTAEVSIED
jgi:membrane fusion protein, multidrug efflux system